MRRTFALWLLILSLACGCAAGLAAPAAMAAGSGGSTPSQPTFGITSAEQNAAAAQQTTTVISGGTATSSSSGGLSGLDAVLIAVVAVLVLGGIAFWVWYDARGHAARVGHGAHDDTMFGQRAHAGSKAARRPRKLKPAERKRRKRGRAR